MKTKSALFLFLRFLILSTCFIHGETLNFGGADGWEQTHSKGLMETDGLRGYRAQTLEPLGRNPFIQDNQANLDLIDLLLLAGTDGIDNPTGRYMVTGNYQISHRFPARGNTSIRLLSGGFSLLPSLRSMWAPGLEWGNFSLEFRLRPVSLGNGDIFFSWEGHDENGVPQSIVARTENRRLVWEFHRFFRRENSRSLTFSLTSPPLLPGEWRHHQIQFDTENSSGVLEYLVDGIPVDIIHATPNGRENMDVFTPLIGLRSDQPLYIAPRFSGYLDEFRLTASSAHHTGKGTLLSGSGRTKVINSGYPGSTLSEVRARFDTPELSRIRFYARSFDTQEQSQMAGFPHPADPDWVELTMQEEDEDPLGFGRWHYWRADTPLTGHYFTVGYIMDSDPTTHLAPILSNLEMTLDARLPPRPPRNLAVEEQDNGNIDISWSPDAEAQVAGWWIFWGPRPDEYIPTGANDSLYGSAWIPRNRQNTVRPHFSWSKEQAHRIIYTSIHAAWPEGAPHNNVLPAPSNYNALSKPAKEVIFSRSRSAVLPES